MRLAASVRRTIRFLALVLSIVTLAAPVACRAEGAGDQTGGILFKLDWSGATDFTSPLPDGWNITQGSHEHFALVNAALGEEGRFLRIANVAGQPRILSVPVKDFPRSGRLLLELEFGVEAFLGSGDAVFTTLGAIIDLRVRARDGRIVLLDLDRNATRLGVYRPGRFINVALEIDVDQKRIPRAWIDGQLVEEFTGVPWRSSSIPGNIQLIATTPSAADIYWKKVVIKVIESPDERTGNETAEPGSQTADEIPSIGSLLSQRIDFLADRERLARALDLSVKMEAIDRPPAVDLFFTPEQLRSLPELIARDPATAATWKAITDSVRETLILGTFKRSSRPYIYTLLNELPKLALAYLLTGNQRLGEFMRAVLLDVAERPMEFWIHSELRPYNPARPVGGLETATLARGVAIALNWAFDVLEPHEATKVKDALRTKGLEPTLRWLENARQNNWRAVMSVGAYITAKVLGDARAMAVAEEHMREYVRVVEDDGSYGEQIGYFEYGVASLIPGLMALEIDEIRDIVSSSGLARSLEWITSYYGFADEGNGRLGAGRFNFGDDDFPDRPNPTVTYFLANATGSGLGTWLIERFHGESATGDWVMLVLLAKYQGARPPATSPAELGLDTLRAFDNGVGIIRSSWEPNGIVFGIRSGGASRTGYAHDRPDRNSIVLFAGGEYLLVAPGRASYRSPIRQNWDLLTSSHNTITFDGETQLREPVASIVAARPGDVIDYLASEAAPSYANKPERARRHIYFVKDPGYFVILDEVRLRAGEFKRVDAHLHFNNHDGRGVLRQMSDADWLFERPRASLQVHIASRDPVEQLVEKGIMHKGYSYYPGDPNEGSPGTSVKLRTTTQEPVSQTDFYTVLLPRYNDGQPLADVDVIAGGQEATITVDHGTYIDSFVFNLSAGGRRAEFTRRQGDSLIVRQALAIE